MELDEYQILDSMTDSEKIEKVSVGKIGVFLQANQHFLGLVSNTFNFNFKIWISKTECYSEFKSLHINLWNNKLKKKGLFHRFEVFS